MSSAEPLGFKRYVDSADKDQFINFNGLVRLDKDPFLISFLNFKKDQNFETKIEIFNRF